MSNITLSFNGSQAPAIFQVGSLSVLAALVGGSTPAAVDWSYGTRYGPRTIGNGLINFAPAHAEPHYLDVTATLTTGIVVESLFVLNVTVGGVSAAEVTIRWADPAPQSAGLNSATINVSGVVPPRSIGWSRFLNGVEVDSGRGAAIGATHLQPGVHRVFATVIDAAGNTVIGDSSVYVPAGFGLQSAVVPPQPFDSSLIYLGCAFSPVLEGNPSLSTALPSIVASLDSSVRLIPGSTHFSVDLDPELNQVDDEVVVRTQLGNWTLVGPPNGLTSESLPYDYQHGQPFQPAPLDLSVRYGAEVWNAHSASVGAFRFKVRFRCFRSGDPVYRYTPCDWSGYSGGTGERQRRLVALVTNADLSLDDESPQNRLGSRSVETFTVQDQGFLTGAFDTDGKPDRPAHDEDHFYTDQNTLAVYESVNGLGDLHVHGVYAMPSVRPCVLDFSKPGHPRIVNKVKRLWGKLMLYLAGGALTRGTVIKVRVYTGAAPGYEDISVTVNQDVYNPGYNGFVKAAEGAIDLSDFEFDRLGVVMDFTLDESRAGTAVPSTDPMMTAGEDFYYSRVMSPAIRIDTACFRNPVLMPSFEGTFVGSAVPLPDCNTLVCGPIGTYCYAEMNGTGTLAVLQPLGYPAPFVAPYSDTAHCYGNPSFLGEYLGGKLPGTEAVFGYTGTTGCGAAYQYNPCLGAADQQLSIVFPTNATPHPAVSYLGHCYTLIGRVHDTRQLINAPLAAVSPVSDCLDVACTGSSATGGSVDYVDQETSQLVTVAFPHLDSGVPYFAVAGEVTSQGYGLTPDGSLNYAIYHSALLNVLTVAEDATLDFDITPHSIWRDLVVNHNGVRSHYRFYPGLSQSGVSVQAGDLVTLDFGNRLKLYQGVSGQVRWHKQISVPYAYDTATVAIPGAFGTLTALGFCGLTSRQDYSFFGTLGSAVVMDLPNPDGVVTIKDNSSLPEMVVIRTKQAAEADPQFNMPTYAAQRLRTPLVFKFYATRSRVGRHGEMDVWFNRSNPSFPPYFTAGPFKSLALSDTASYRKVTQQGDTNRRGLRVAAAAQATEATSPGVYVDYRGNRISVMTESINDYIYMPGNPNPYTFENIRDQGISETLYWHPRGGGGPVQVSSYDFAGTTTVRSLCYVPTADQVWVAGSDSTVYVFSGDGSNLVKTLPVGTHAPYGIDYCVVNDTVAVSCIDDGAVRFIDVSTGTVSKTVLTSAIVGADYFCAYNPTSQNVYTAGIAQYPYLAAWEIDPVSGAVNAYPQIGNSNSVTALFYCPTTGETYFATQEGAIVFNTNTKEIENLALGIASSGGACAAPELARVVFTSAANSGWATFFADPRTRMVLKTYPNDGQVIGAGWHPLRRKFYFGHFNQTLGQFTAQIVDINGQALENLIVPSGDYIMAWVYSPGARLMFCIVPEFVTPGSGEHLLVYT